MTIMTIILIFAAASIVISLFTVSACMLSSRISQQESLAEEYVTVQVTLRTASQTSF